MNGTSITPMRRVRLGSPGQVQEARVSCMSSPEAALELSAPREELRQRVGARSYRLVKASC